MPKQGQAYPSTFYQSHRAKVSDGKSVKVKVPEKTTIEAQRFYILDGFFGAAVQDVVTTDGESSEVTLTIEQAEFETDQTNASQDYKVGTPLFFNQVSGKFTETAAGNRFVGIVTSSKDARGAIWFKLAAQANGMVQAVAQADSSAADVSALVADFNSLLTKLRAAGILAE